jgi:nucleotide-binding universal stress UspA family protein
MSHQEEQEGSRVQESGKEGRLMKEQVLLLGVDMDLSSATQSMLQMAGSWLAELAPQSPAALLTVIPVPYDTPSALGRFRGQAPRLSATAEQRRQARCILQRAWAVLEQAGIAPGRLDMQVREGVPAEELVQVAAERQVACIVLGHRGSALRHRLRRLLLGSTTAQVLRKAPCPVLLVPAPSGPTNLVAWYEAAITRELSTRASGLSRFTPEEVAARFPPPHGAGLRPREVIAAKKALLHLAEQGVLICQQVKGTWQCFND